MTKILLVLADPMAGPIGTAPLTVTEPTPELPRLPDDAFFVADVRRAWRSICGGIPWPLTGGERICWSPPASDRPLSGPSANLAVAIALIARARGLELAVDEIWATGRLAEGGQLEGVMGVAHKVELFLAADQNRRRVFFAPLENHDQIERSRASHAGRFEEAEFLPQRGAIPTSERPLIVWIARDDTAMLLRALSGELAAERRRAQIFGAGAAAAVGALACAVAVWVWSGERSLVSGSSGGSEPRDSANTISDAQRQLYIDAAKDYSTRIEEWLELHYARLSEAAASDSLRYDEREAHLDALDRLALSMPEFGGGVYSLDAHGVVIAQSAPAYPDLPDIQGYDAGHREYFVECQRHQRPVVTSSFTSADRREEIIVLAVPRRSPAGHFIGILDAVVDVSSTPFSSLATASVPESLIERGLELHLIDARGVVIGTSNPTRIGKSLDAHPTLQAVRAGTESAPGVLVPIGQTPLAVFAMWSARD
jgi:hypothetical protein